MKISGSYISYIASVFPSKKISNTDLNLFTEKEKKFFEKTVGIKSRYWSSTDETSTGLAMSAAKYLLEESNVDKSKVRQLLFVSQTPDQQIPFTSNILQDQLGLPTETFTQDINAGCAGFVQALFTAFCLNQTLNTSEHTLIVISETLSKKLDSKDKTTTTLFGDGASSILITRDEKLTHKSIFQFNSDGGKGNSIKLSKEFNNTLRMDGQKVFDFTLSEVTTGFKKFIQKNNLNLRLIDKFYFHQSNRFILNQFQNMLEIPHDKLPINIESFGNTSGVSIPLLVSSSWEADTNVKDVVFCGYGSGLSWGYALTVLDKCKVYKPRLCKL